jgi:hypothetical protein
MLIVEACIQRNNDAFDFPDNETSDVRVRDGEDTIDPDDFLKLGVEVLPLISFLLCILGGFTRNRSLTASRSLPVRVPLVRLELPLMYVTSNK